MSFVKNPNTKRYIRVNGPTYNALERKGVRVKRLKRYRRVVYRTSTNNTITIKFTVPYGAPTGRGPSTYTVLSSAPISDVLQEADRRYRSIIIVHPGGRLLGLAKPLSTPIGKAVQAPYTYAIMPIGDAVKGSQYVLLLKYMRAGFEKLSTPKPKKIKAPVMQETELSQVVFALREKYPKWSFMRALRHAKTHLHVR